VREERSGVDVEEEEGEEDQVWECWWEFWWHFGSTTVNRFCEKKGVVLFRLHSGLPSQSSVF